MTNTIDLTQLATTGAGTGYLVDRNYQIWQSPGDTPKIRRHAFLIGSPDWGSLTPTAGDIIKVLELGPTTTGGGSAGVAEYVIAGFVNVITAAGSAYSTSTVNLGDGGSGTQYITAFPLSVAGFTISPFTTAKLYTAAGFLEVTTATSSGVGAVIDAGVISFQIQTANNNL